MKKSDKALKALKPKPTEFGYFTHAHIEELKSILDLSDQSIATECARAISAQIALCEYLADARRRVPRNGDAKARLLDIAMHAKALDRLLSQEPDNESLFIPPEQVIVGSRVTLGGIPVIAPHSVESRKNLVTLDEIKAIGRRPVEFRKNLRSLAMQAHLQATNDHEFARVRVLVQNVTTKNPESSISSRILWPLLFDLWRDVGKRLAWTEDGPLHRFLAFVHRVAFLPPPKHSTFRDAARKWTEQTKS